MNVLAQMTWVQLLLALVLVFVCLLLMVVILLQRGRGGGLAGAFGGAGGTSAFGAKTGDVFTWITVVVATVFLLLAVVADFAFEQSAKRTAHTAPAKQPAGPDAGPDAAGEAATAPGADTGGSARVGKTGTSAGEGSEKGESMVLPITVVPLPDKGATSPPGESSGEEAPDATGPEQPRDRPTEAPPPDPKTDPEAP